MSFALLVMEIWWCEVDQLRWPEFFIFAYCRSTSSHSTMWMAPFNCTCWCDQNAVSIVSIAFLVVEIWWCEVDQLRWPEFFIFAYCRSTSSHRPLWMVLSTLLVDAIKTLSKSCHLDYWWWRYKKVNFGDGKVRNFEGSLMTAQVRGISWR